MGGGRTANASAFGVGPAKSVVYPQIAQMTQIRCGPSGGRRIRPPCRAGRS